MTKNKDLALEGLRGLACLSVVVGHFTYIFFPYLENNFRPIPGVQPAYLVERLLEYPPFTLAFSADAAVSIFFVLSGYVLTTKYFRNHEVSALQSAATKRYVRLMIPCFASVVLAWVIWRAGLTFSQDALAIHVAGWVPTAYAGHFRFSQSIIQGLFGAPLFGICTLNAPLWSIQVELIGSLLLFFVLAALGRHPMWLVFWFLFFADILGYRSSNVLYYVSFGAGAALNPAREWLKRHEPISLTLAIFGIIGVAFNHFYTYRPIEAIPLPDLAPYGPNFADGVPLTSELWWHSIGAVLLVAGAIGSRRVAAAFASRLPVLLGKLSFAIYVLHWPILMSVGLGAAWGLQKIGIPFVFSVVTAFVVFMSTTFAMATLFERFIDRPSIRLADMISMRALKPIAIDPGRRQLVSDNLAFADGPSGLSGSQAVD